MTSEVFGELLAQPANILSTFSNISLNNSFAQKADQIIRNFHRQPIADARIEHCEAFFIIKNVIKKRKILHPYLENAADES